MPRSAASLIAAAAFAAAVALAASCGGDDHSQANARDLATGKSCDYYARCGQIGAGLMFASRDACEVSARNTWQNLWPPADCDGKIVTSALDLCLAGIDSTLCGNGADQFNTVFVKCAKADVCAGP